MVARGERTRSALAPSALVALLTLGCGGTTGTNDRGLVERGSPTGCTLTLSQEEELVVRTPAQLDLLREHRLVTGNLIIDCPECTTLAPLACLEEVGGMLGIVGCDQLESLEGLSALRRLGLQASNGGLAVGFHFAPWQTSGNARLRTLGGLGPLERVEGRIDVRKNPELRDLSGLFGLKHVAGSLFVEGNDALPSLQDLSELSSVRGTLEIADNDALVDLTGLGSLVQARGFGVGDNDALTTLAGLDRFWGESSDLVLGISGNPVLTDLTALKNVQGTIGSLGLLDNASLRAVTLNPGLAVISGGLSVSNNAVLESFVAPGLTHVGQSLQIEGNPLLATLDLGAPARVGALTVRTNGVLRDTAALAQVRIVTGYLGIDGNAQLERVTLPELQEVGEEVQIQGNQALTALELGSLRHAKSLSVSGNRLLPSCQVTDLLSAVDATSAPSQCGNGPDECAMECPPRP